MSDQILFQNNTEINTIEVTLFVSVSAYRHEKIHFVHPEAHIAHNSVFSFKKSVMLLFFVDLQNRFLQVLLSREQINIELFIRTMCVIVRC
jgi:hypothetical protein